jgi:hypothetical protein
MTNINKINTGKAPFRKPLLKLIRRRIDERWVCT